MTAGTAPEIARKLRREMELALVFIVLLLDLDLNVIDCGRRGNKQIGYWLPGGLLCVVPVGLAGPLIELPLAPRPGPPPPRRILRGGGCFT